MTRLQSIEHFVVLMLENRSFDNLLGGLYPKSKDFDGRKRPVGFTPCQGKGSQARGELLENSATNIKTRLP